MEKTPAPAMEAAERTALIRAMIRHYRELYRAGKLTDDDLWHFIRIVYGYEIPRKVFCAEHDAPFDFIADAFFGRCPHGAAIAFANRGGGKTLDTAILENAGMLICAPLEICHYGSVMYQADKCYDYFTQLAQIETIANEFTSILKGDAKTVGGSKLAIFTATISAVSGPHPHWAFMDEVETLERPGVLQKFQGMSQSTGDNHAIDIYTSTRDKAYGTFQRLLEWAREIGIKVYKWCIWDVLQTCPATDDCMECSARTRERCQGRARLTQGFYPIQDFRDKSAKVDDDTWEAQWLCLRPQRTGAVYKEFNEEIHVKPLRWDKDSPVVLVMDPGWREDPKSNRGSFALYDMQTSSMDIVRVLRENRFSERTPFEVGQAMRSRHKGPWVWSAIICDPADPAAALDFCKGYGQDFRIIKFDKADIQTGIRDIHNLLRVRADATVGLLIDPSCKDGIWEMLAYTYPEGHEDRPLSENPIDVNNHFPDCLRYYRKAYGRVKGDTGMRVGPRRDIDKILEGY